MSLYISWCSLYFDIPVKGVGFNRDHPDENAVFFVLTSHDNGHEYHVYHVSTKDMSKLNKERRSLEESNGFTIYHDERYSTVGPKTPSSNFSKISPFTPEALGPVETISLKDIINPIPHSVVNNLS